jgi:hypothetical protein
MSRSRQRLQKLRHKSSSPGFQGSQSLLLTVAENAELDNTEVPDTANNNRSTNKFLRFTSESFDTGDVPEEDVSDSDISNPALEDEFSGDFDIDKFDVDDWLKG